MIRAGLHSFFVATLLLIGQLVSASELPMGNGQQPSTSHALNSIPLGKGLPVVVHGSLFFHDISEFNENSETFTATTDLRLIWQDPRLAYPPSEGLHGYKEYRFSQAQKQLEKIWHPQIRYLNRESNPQNTDPRLRIFPDGVVELTSRSQATYRATVNLDKFPFDRQHLPISVSIHEDTLELVDLQLDSNDMAFMGISNTTDLAGWRIGLVNLERSEVKGWNGDRYARLDATASLRRDPMTTVSTIFIPLLSSLLIPLLATWINRLEGGKFMTETFEPVNIVIGGLFATIALAFTISSTMPALVISNNSVTQLLALNYAGLAFGLIVTVVFYRYELPKRYFGRFVQEAAFEFLVWAFPATIITLSTTYILLAMA